MFGLHSVDSRGTTEGAELGQEEDGIWPQGQGDQLGAFLSTPLAQPVSEADRMVQGQMG